MDVPGTGPGQVEQQLKQLETRNHWMWALTALLLVALGLALVSVQITGTASGSFLDEGAGYVLLVGLSGLVVLFSLYMLLKQHQIHALRRELFEAAVLQESLRSRLAGLSSLFEGVTDLGIQIELDSLLQAIAEHTRTSLDAQQSSVMLFDEESRELRCVAVSGDDVELVRGSHARIGEGIAGWVAEHNRPLVLTPERVEKQFPFAAKPNRIITSGMSVPLALPDRIIGVLNVTRRVPGPVFNADEARIVTLFAAHLATAIRRVHERKQSEDALREREELLRRSQKMESLGRLAGGIAHDYNNLLTVMLSSVARLNRDLPPDHALRPAVERIADATSRCASFTRQLLTFGRKQVVELGVLDLNARVVEMSTLLRRLIGENIELVTVLEPDLGPVRADSAQIEEVLMNLVVNAREALPTGGRLTIETSNVWLDAVAVSAHPGAAAGDHVLLTVRDTGFGMDAETQAHAFEPFFTTKSQRTGLGLSMVYAVVQQCAGFIEVESTPGRGTTFRIYLPRVEGAIEAPPAPAPIRPGPEPGATILLVEDETGVRSMVREMLEDYGLTVIEASWAGEAVMLSETYDGSIDLLITDVVMPGESGGELARWMSQVRPEMPVLYMSGYPGDALAQHGVRIPGASFLPKPFTEETLIARVRALLDARPDRGRGALPLGQAA